MKSKFASVVLSATVMLISSAVVAKLAIAAENDSGRRGVPVPQALPGVGLGTAVLSAVVNANGTVVRGSGVSRVVRTSVGNYRVLFTRNVRSCTYVASIGLSGSVGTEVNSSIDVAGDNLSVNGVFVDTENFAGTQVDRGFHLIVFCDQ